MCDESNMNLRTGPLLLLLAGGLVFAACGGSDGEPTTSAPSSVAATTIEDGVSPDTTAVSTTNQSVPTVPRDTQADAATEPVTSGPRWLASLITDERVGDGWTVPPGDWTTNAFGPPVTFTTNAELTLVGEYRDVVVFLDPSASAPRYLYIARAAFIKNASAAGPVPATPDEITNLIEELPMVDLVESGTTTIGATTWWDLTVADFSDGAPYGCELGDRCGPISFTRDRISIDALEGEVSRVYRTDVDGDRIGVYVTGPSDGREHLLGIADQLVDSLRLGSPTDPEPDSSFFGMLGTSRRSLPAGRHVVRFPAATLTFALDEPLEGVTIALNKINTIWITTGSAGLGLVPGDRLIDPDADQLEIRGTDQPTFTYLDPPIESTAEWLDWTIAMNGTPTTIDDETLGGLAVTYVGDTADDRAANSGPCDAADAPGRCYTAFTSDGVAWYSTLDQDLIARGGYVEEADIIVTIVSLDDSALDEVIADLAPLLDTLDIDPVNEA